jgi:ketosteroid isomerase-like protein
MSENVELVQSIYEALARGEPKPADWAHPEIEFVFADGPSPGTSTGVAAMVAAWRDYLDAWEDYRSEPEEFRELDDARVLVLDHVQGHGRTSGVDLGQVPLKSADLFHFRDGKVVKVVIYFDRARALSDLGLER